LLASAAPNDDLVEADVLMQCGKYFWPCTKKCWAVGWAQTCASLVLEACLRSAVLEHACLLFSNSILEGSCCTQRFHDIVVIPSLCHTACEMQLEREAEARKLREAEARKLEAKKVAAGTAPAAPPPTATGEAAGQAPASGTAGVEQKAAAPSPAVPASSAGVEKAADPPPAAQGAMEEKGGLAMPMAVDEGGAAGSGLKREQPPSPAPAEDGSGKRRRRGAAVDYAQLNAQLEAAKKAGSVP